LLTLRLTSLKSPWAYQTWLVPSLSVFVIVSLVLVSGVVWLTHQQAVCDAAQARVDQALAARRQQPDLTVSTSDVLLSAKGMLSVLAAMQRAPVQGVCFDSVRHIGQRFVFHGRAASAIQLSAFMETWPVSPWFSHLTLGSFTRLDAAGSVRFEFTANEA
jgi:Tfp pilus assembly protein PilN